MCARVPVYVCVGGVCRDVLTTRELTWSHSHSTIQHTHIHIHRTIKVIWWNTNKDEIPQTTANKMRLFVCNIAPICTRNGEIYIFVRGREIERESERTLYVQCFCAAHSPGTRFFGWTVESRIRPRPNKDSYEHIKWETKSQWYRLKGARKHHGGERKKTNWRCDVRELTETKERGEERGRELYKICLFLIKRAILYSWDNYSYNPYTFTRCAYKHIPRRKLFLDSYAQPAPRAR